jgi:DNA-binding ferritin-like protein
VSVDPNLLRVAETARRLQQPPIQPLVPSAAVQQVSETIGLRQDIQEMLDQARETNPVLLEESRKATRLANEALEESRATRSLTRKLLWLTAGLLVLTAVVIAIGIVGS